MRQSIIRAENISKSYSLESRGDITVLKNVSLEVYDGDFISLVGPSGAGKSTLLHLLGGLDSPDTGSVKYSINSNEYDMGKLSKNELAGIRNSSIGFVFQAYHLLPEFTAIENVMMPNLIAGISHSKAQENAIAIMKRVGMSHRLEHKPSELSGGEQQRVAIARALVNNPIFLFADEPTGNLDSANTEQILQLLKEIRHEHSLTMIIATHSPDVAKSATRVITMRDGKIIQ
jgi:lipoprotein-releasing system ATP-binding protein